MNSVYNYIGPEHYSGGNIIDSVHTILLSKVSSAARLLVPTEGFIVEIGDLIGDEIRDNPRIFAL